jgi:hypothetical protein
MSTASPVWVKAVAGAAAPRSAAVRVRVRSMAQPSIMVALGPVTDM